jgi:hypothetical protein
MSIIHNSVGTAISSAQRINSLHRRLAAYQEALYNHTRDPARFPAPVDSLEAIQTEKALMQIVYKMAHDDRDIGLGQLASSSTLIKAVA